jgi:transposase-like protein
MTKNDTFMAIKYTRAMNVSQQIKELFKMLSPIEQQGLLSDLSSGDVNCQRKESNVTSCPYCCNERFVKNGIYRGFHRYKCKSCNRNFSPHSGTAFQGIKKLDKFEQYKTIMFEEGLVSLEKMSKRVGISIQTAFDWRHKILSTLKPEAFEFSGITEMDDVWFLYSQKGRKGLAFSRKRGGSSRKGDSDYQVKMLVTADRAQAQDLSVVRIGRIKSSDINRKVGHRMGPECTLVSDKHRSISSFAKQNEIKHVSFKAIEHVADKEHHVQKVNNIASRLKAQTNHICRGVSTKYLQSYANWFQFAETYKKQGDIVAQVDKALLANHKSWDTFTNIEPLYKQFIKQQSRRTYRCPTKRSWKSQQKEAIKVEPLSYL